MPLRPTSRTGLRGVTDRRTRAGNPQSRLLNTLTRTRGEDAPPNDPVRSWPPSRRALSTFPGTARCTPQQRWGSGWPQPCLHRPPRHPARHRRRQVKVLQVSFRGSADKSNHPVHPSRKGSDDFRPMRRLAFLAFQDGAGEPRPAIYPACASVVRCLPYVRLMTVLARAWPLLMCSRAAAASWRGKTRSTTGWTAPASMSRARVWRSAPFCVAIRGTRR
jgi:hypothetical protein